MYLLYAKSRDISTFVTGDIKAHQVLLNRVPEQATEDSVKYEILLLRKISEWKLQYLHNATRS